MSSEDEDDDWWGVAGELAAAIDAEVAADESYSLASVSAVPVSSASDRRVGTLTVNDPWSVLEGNRTESAMRTDNSNISGRGGAVPPMAVQKGEDRVYNKNTSQSGVDDKNLRV